jgi:hypothetical protein
MVQHVHVHLHQAPAALAEVHWHVYLEPVEGTHPDKETNNLQIINPPNNQPWNVRPPTPGSSAAGYICADGNALVGGEPADSVWAFIFDHNPLSAEVAIIPPGAVCGRIDSHTGDWVFRHDTPQCTAGPHGMLGQMGTEIPGARHSTTGVANWLAVWGKKGLQKDVDIHRFLGITSTTTSCGGGSAGIITGPMAEPAALPPLPAAFLAHFKDTSSKPKSVRLEYSHAASQSHQPVWLSQCALWRLSVEMIDDSVLAQLDGCWSLKDKSLHARWSGLLAPKQARNKLMPAAPAKVLGQMSPVELEGTQ